jgi:hypothetical protein
VRTSTMNKVRDSKADALAHRIATITDMLARKSTPDGERAAAERLLARLNAEVANLAEAVGETAEEWGRYYRLPDGWYGAKYEAGRFLSATELAAQIRADIKLARKLGKKPAKPGEIKIADPIGDAPADFRFFVKKQSYSGGRSIYVTVKGVPTDWWTTEKAYWDDNVEYVVAGDRLADLGQALRDLANAYNYDRSDAMTDYFDVNFYLHVEADGHPETDYTREVRPRRRY